MSTISYQGIPGSFSHIVARKLFGERDELVGTREFREIFERVSSGQDSAGVVPLENTLAGSVYENYDLLLHFALSISAEHYLRVEHHLMALPRRAPDAGLSSLLKVFSHQKALEQCGQLFREFPHLERSVHNDTAGAAKLVADRKDAAPAAIASEEAARLYGLEILRRNVEDNPHNITRFIVVERSCAGVTQPTKCSIIFSLPHQPGSLAGVLAVLARRGLNLSKIESRPIAGRPFEYNFYVDFEFSNGPLAAALEELARATRSLKVLGLYRAAGGKVTTPGAGQKACTL